MWMHVEFKLVKILEGDWPEASAPTCCCATFQTYHRPFKNANKGNKVNFLSGRIISLKIKKTFYSAWRAVKVLLLVGHKIFEDRLHTIKRVYQACSAAGAKLLHHYIYDKVYWTCHILWLYYRSAEREFHFSFLHSVLFALKLTLLDTYM